MLIKRIVANNFKSFGRLELDLDRFNVVVGANESGKSNFISILRFLRDITGFNLRDAISIQGGVKYLRNISLGASQDLAVEVTLQPGGQGTLGIRKKRKYFAVRTNELTYGFALRFKKRGSGFQIASDYFHVKFAVFRFEPHKNNTPDPSTQIWNGEGNVRRSGKKLTFDVHMPSDTPLKKDDLFPTFIRDFPLAQKGLMCEQPFYFQFLPSGPLFSDIGIYDFDPKLSKKAVLVSGRAELEEGAGNLALVLRNVIENARNRRKLVNLFRDLLPFVEDTRIERLTDKSVLFTIRERYFQKRYLPASLVSDGTIAIAALIVALYFQEKSVLAIEEAERNIHPYLISKIVEMMKDASKNKQIIVTTHNPDLVRQAGIENLLLVTRDKNGFSNISKPADKREIRQFLQNEIGVEELYAKNLLEV